MRINLDNILEGMSAAARQAVLADKKLQRQLVRIYRENSDRRGARGEIACSTSIAFTERKTARYRGKEL